jgi:hypothetical protein
MAGNQPELRFYNRNHVCVPPKSPAAFYAIETIRHSSYYRGEEYISRHDRTGWLVSSPNKKTKFKNHKAMHQWIDAQVKGS